MKLCNIEDQYKKFPSLKRDEVKKLMDWCQKQAHLPRNITELEVILFLHSNYNKIEATKTTIDNYYTCRTHMGMFFGSRDVTGQDVKTAHDIFTMIPLPQLTKEGHKVILARLHNTDPSKFDLAQCLKLFSMFCDTMLLEEGCMEGHVIILDLTNVTLGHVARLSVIAIKNFLYYLQEALPFRLKGLHFINIVPFVDKIVFLMKPFMKKELWDVFHLHSTMKTVYEKVDMNVFPEDYEGGQEKPIKFFHEKCYQHLVESRKYFLEDEQSKKVNEKLRAVKRKDAGDVFGLEGNFRINNMDFNFIAKLDVSDMSKRFPDFREDDIQKIRMWLEKSPHLPKITDYEIFRFLHSTDFSVETSKTKIDNFYTFRTISTEYFEHRDPDTEEIQYISETVCHQILPKRTPENNAIVHMSLLDPSNFSFKNYLKISNYGGEFEFMSNENGFADGIVVLVDLKGGTLAHLASLNLFELKKFVFYLTETYPVKLYGAHLINGAFPMLIDKILALVKPMLRNDLANLLFVHNSVESLAKHIPLECLPNDYEGGQLKSIKELSQDYRKYVLQHRDYFLAEPKYRRVDEKLRPAKMKSSMDIFGMEGNFRKLDFD
ncbi:uncharacterized protein LOC134837834 [Culicoides brevitarsis]|uniref:uncharacterized protein LOC134837834 n=1 Tax=Culicoides brevitarsis TaxID=469753 RepID=UPI00307C6E6F